MTTTDMQMNDYLARLRAALTGMTLAEREDIVEEIRMHIRERSSDPQTSMEEILAGLGPADELAQQYRTGLLVQKARHSISPVVILRATLRWATTGVEGFWCSSLRCGAMEWESPFCCSRCSSHFFPSTPDCGSGRENSTSAFAWALP